MQSPPPHLPTGFSVKKKQVPEMLGLSVTATGTALTQAHTGGLSELLGKRPPAKPLKIVCVAHCVIGVVQCVPMCMLLDTISPVMEAETARKTIFATTGCSEKGAMGSGRAQLKFQPVVFQL